MTISTLYWGLASLKRSPKSNVFQELEKAIVEYIDEFSLQSLSNILRTKVIIMKSDDVKPLIDSFYKSMEHRKITHDDLLSLKIMIYSIGQIKTKDESKIELNKKFVKDLVSNYIIWAKDNTSWKYVKQRHVAEIFYTLAKLNIVEIDTYYELYNHIRPFVDKLNNQDIWLLIWAFSKALVYSHTEKIELKHPNFNIEKSLKLFTQRVTVKINKIDGKSASIIVNSLKRFPTYEHFVRQIETRIKSLKENSKENKESLDNEADI